VRLALVKIEKTKYIND